MTKNEIINVLQLLNPSRIKDLDIVYHKTSRYGSYYYRYTYSSMSEFFSTPLCEVLMSLYKQRGYIRAINLVYYDNQGQEHQVDYMARYFVDCDTLSDFINSK